MKTTEKCYLLHINYTGWLLGGGRWVKSNGGWKLGSLKQQEELSNNFFSQHTAERLFSGRDLVLTGAALPLKLGGWAVGTPWRRSGVSRGAYVHATFDRKVKRFFG